MFRTRRTLPVAPAGWNDKGEVLLAETYQK